MAEGEGIAAGVSTVDPDCGAGVQGSGQQDGAQPSWWRDESTGAGAGPPGVSSAGPDDAMNTHPKKWKYWDDEWWWSRDGSEWIRWANQADRWKRGSRAQGSEEINTSDGWTSGVLRLQVFPL